MINYIFDLDDTIYIHEHSKFFSGSIHYGLIQEKPLLKYYLNLCKGPKYIYTNATYSHADTVLKKMNLSDGFEKIYSRDTMKLMKPHLESAISVQKDILYHNNLNKLSNKLSNNQRDQYIFFDDLLSNLEMAKKLGWKTIWIHRNCYINPKHRFVDHAFPSLIEALRILN